MIDEQTVKCKFCGNPYKVYGFLVADQSCCPSCQNKAKSSAEAPAHKCPICGLLYAVYKYFAGDQSACPKCISKANNSWKKQYNESPYFNDKEFYCNVYKANEIVDNSAISYDLEN